MNDPINFVDPDGLKSKADNFIDRTNENIVDTAKNIWNSDSLKEKTKALCSGLNDIREDFQETLTDQIDEILEK